MYSLIRPLLFRLDPERAHGLTLRAVALAGRIALTRSLLQSMFGVHDPRLEVECFGLRFRNPVGLAAGYDKDAVAIRGLSSLGFGHVEVGTLTCKPQPGNTKPRVWRVPTSRALVNSMGFPNVGAERARIQRSEARVGVNIGKSKETPIEEAAADYLALLDRVHTDADYVALNVSSPNTVGLRHLQAHAAIEELLSEVARRRDSLHPRVPLLVKIAPDLTEAEIDGILSAAESSGIDGIIATNTTIARKGLPDWAKALPGGLSGAPLRERSTDVIRYITRVTHGRLPIIGVGGIMSGADALEKIRAGANLVQVYTGLVYAGPGLVKQINRTLIAACERAGARNIAELVGQEK